MGFAGAASAAPALFQAEYPAPACRRFSEGSPSILEMVQTAKHI